MGGAVRFEQVRRRLSLLNIWFNIAIGLPTAHKLGGITTNAWAQTLAWLAGSAVWMAVTCVLWLARGMKRWPPPVRGIPGDLSPRELNPPDHPVRGDPGPRAVGQGRDRVRLALQKADWMPLAALVAMSPD